MASSKTFPLFLLLITLSSLHSTHAREVKSFNKAATTTTTTATNTVNIPNNNNEPQTNQPDFIPESENAYGLYGHESGQLPPSTTASKYLPKNYNPVAYVTQPDTTTDNTPLFTQSNSFRSNPEINDNNYNTGAENYYNNQHETEETEERSGNRGSRNNNYYYNNQQETEETEYRSGNRGNRNNNYYYNLGSSFNSNPELYGRGGAANNGGGFERKGMSDTRFLENGKYYYDVNTEKYSSNHPYESLKSARARNEYSNRNYYGNNENTYEFNGGNSMGGYQNQNDFQGEENNMP